MSAISKKQRIKGQALLDQAEKTLSKKTWFASSTESKYEDAADQFQKAANAFKVGGCNDEAGNAYLKAANIFQEKLKQMGEASKCLQNAGSCFKKTNTTEAVASFQSAVTLLCDAGRLTQAAKLSKEIGEIFENEGVEDNSENEGGEQEGATLAIEHYDRAAELYEMEQQAAQSSNCKAKVAELCSAALDPPDLLRAAKIYDELGRRCLDTNLLKFNAKGYFLQSIMCNLANNDSVGASQVMNRYESLDYTFGDSREGTFARSLLECVENYDSEGFATACYEFDRITKLDPWKTSMLVKVKRSIEDDNGGGDEEDDVDLT